MGDECRTDAGLEWDSEVSREPGKLPGRSGSVDKSEEVKEEEVRGAEGAAREDLETTREGSGITREGLEVTRGDLEVVAREDALLLGNWVGVAFCGARLLGGGVARELGGGAILT